MKDNFSTKSDKYAQYRPGYPPELFSFLRRELKSRKIAWDCGTGNGQVAGELAKFFDRVEATDISVPQLMNAISKPNIYYSKQRAENTNFPDSCFDLVTVAQAIHWFDFDDFYREVNRVLKPGGFIAVIGYDLFKSNPATIRVIQHFYKNIIGPYWDPERRYLDEQYKSIPFPFEEIEVPRFEQRLQWDFEHLIGYLKTWSAVKHYEKERGENPVDIIAEELKKSFGRKGEIIYPILFRLGRVS